MAHRGPQGPPAQGGMRRAALWRRAGALRAPRPLLRQEQAAALLRELRAWLCFPGDPEAPARETPARAREPVRGDMRFKMHLLLPALWRTVHSPVLLQQVCHCLGTRDVLLWSTDFNVKPARSAGFFSWHQDGHFAGLTPPDAVLTAWLALTPSHSRSGCLRVLPGAHCTGLPHVERPSDDNLLSAGQQVEDAVLRREMRKHGEETEGRTLEECSLPLELRPGEFSLHSFRCVHGSGPNREDFPRIGFAMRFMAANVARKEIPGMEWVRESATLVSGTCDWSVFDPEEAPMEPMGALERERHREAIRRENANYFAQMKARSAYHV